MHRGITECAFGELEADLMLLEVRFRLFGVPCPVQPVLRIYRIVSTIERLCQSRSYRLAAIIWAACWRLVSVTLAPDNMRATSWVRARSSRTRIWVLVRPSDSRFSTSEVLIGEGGDLRQMGDAENLLAAAEGFELLADGFGGAASDADVDFVEDQSARGGSFSWVWRSSLRR